ncbi:uncharacterized protein FIBRA_01286 [Fibroporia radiculosa]|uniref:Inositol-pentakisphosphate 2-kinase n=1 Tax=Fibroporia radiculosa TaxID=599839 RepID=J4I8E5_9APHY|nr:uncharacterized protein FIBRA_01286 [Fibroporia radiculosa]CCL99271.1 predicted protein [Fibroporia radiculosa]
MSEQHHISDTSPQHWKYVAEGGVSVAFSYNGPPHPFYDGKVLKLRKVSKHSGLFHPHSEFEDFEDLEGLAVAFDSAILQRLVPREYFPRCEAVQMDSEWLAQLKLLCEAQRPSERRLRDEIDVRRNKAILIEDLVGWDGMTVEIKPKWGFLPSPTHLSQLSCPVKTRTCRFCMHAHMKSTQGNDSALGFCPLDLYSGEELRVRYALSALWDVWLSTSGAINNMRVFVKGVFIKPVSNSAVLAFMLGFKDPASPDQSPPSMAEIRDRFVSALVPSLVKTPVLGLISSLQRTLDSLDIEGLATLWEHSHAESQPAIPFGTNTTQPTVGEWSEFADEYLRRSASDFNKEPLPDELRYHCLSYLLSATFKDCSLMLRLPLSSFQDDQAKVQGSIKVIDLDVKSISRLDKWRRLDRAIVMTYIKVAEPRRCIDQRGSTPKPRYPK